MIFINVMDIGVRNKIIEEYKNGKSSLQISKEIGYSKPTVLKIIKEENLTRKRDRCKSLNIIKEGDVYVLYWTCKICKNQIKRISYNSTLLCRNHFKQIKVSGICKKCSLKLQEGEGNPFYGKKHTKETKLKVSKSRTGKYCGDRNHMKKEEFKLKSSKIVKEYWDSKGDKKKMSDLMKEKHKSGILKNPPRSQDEKNIVKYVQKLGYTVKHSFRIESKIYDLYIPKLNLIFEYHGDYWHCNPKKYTEDYYNVKKRKTAKELWEYDQLKLELAKNLGYNLEVIWESDYKKNKNIINQILTEYETRSNSTSERS